MTHGWLPSRTNCITCCKLTQAALRIKNCISMHCTPSSPCSTNSWVNSKSPLITGSTGSSWNTPEGNQETQLSGSVGIIWTCTTSTWCCNVEKRLFYGFRGKSLKLMVFIYISLLCFVFVGHRQSIPQVSYGRREIRAGCEVHSAANVNYDLLHFGRIPLGLFRRILFRYGNNRTYRISIPKRTDFVLFWKQNCWRDKNGGDETEEVWVHNFPAKRRRLLAILSVPNKPLFRQFCYREQSWRNTILFIPESELIPKEHNYCQFCVFSFQNSPKRTRPWSNHAVLRDIFNCGALQAYISTHECNVDLKEAQFKMSAPPKKNTVTFYFVLMIIQHGRPKKTLYNFRQILKFLNYSCFSKIMTRKPKIGNLTNMTKDFVVTWRHMKTKNLLALSRERCCPHISQQRS